MAEYHQYEILWKKILEVLENTISHITFRTYISTLVPVDLDGTKIVLRTDNELFASTIMKLSDKMKEAIKKAEAGSAALGSEAADLKLRLEMTLTRIDNTLKQLQEFSQTLSNDPNQFVRGRQEKPVLPTGKPR